MSYLNNASKSSWQMPGLHQSKRKQILVCSSHGGWIFLPWLVGWDITMLRTRAQRVVTLQEQPKPVPDTKPIPLLPFIPLASSCGEVGLLWKVGHQCSEQQGFLFSSWTLKASLCPAVVDQFVQREVPRKCPQASPCADVPGYVTQEILPGHCSDI